MRETMEKIERLTMAGFLIDTVVMALIVMGVSELYEEGETE